MHKHMSLSFKENVINIVQMSIINNDIIDIIITYVICINKDESKELKFSLKPFSLNLVDGESS